MKDILALVTRLVVALEVMAQSMSGGSTPSNVIEFTPEPDEVETPAPKAKGKGKAAPKEEAPKVDYQALRDEGSATIKKMVEGGTEVAAIKKIVTKHGAAKFSELPDDKLEAFLSDLKALAELSDEV